MKQIRIWLILQVLISAVSVSVSRAQQSLPPTPQVVDLKSTDGTLLKATYFAAAKPGPAVLLFHQSNRTRTSWDDVARQLAAAGINTLEIDSRAHGESGGTLQEASKMTNWQADAETAFQFLVSQPGVQRDVIGLGGAGSLGMIHEVETARLHPADIKSLVMMSGETFRPGIEFLHQASQLPELFVVADSDEYPPTVEAMLWMYARASSPSRKLIHYSAAQEAPWLWYETSDASRVRALGGHGTDLFKDHPDLPGILVQWFVNTLIKTPGHAPADPLATAAILNQLEMPGGAAQVTQQLIEARKRDPKAQLFPEVTVDIIASGYIRDGQIKPAIEIFKLNLLAYPDSADAHFNLADAYLQDGQQVLARQLAQEALALLDAHKVPLSSWSDTDQRRAEIREGIQDTLKKLAEGNK
jgi:tetratricopeptide (TPR) repeat protein